MNANLPSRNHSAGPERSPDLLQIFDLPWSVPRPPSCVHNRTAARRVVAIELAPLCGCPRYRLIYVGLTGEGDQ
jgi:hypothetical protein